MLKTFKSFVANESGATAIEYALIASLIAVALVTILTNLGTRLSTEFSTISGALLHSLRALTGAPSRSPQLTGWPRRTAGSLAARRR